MKWPSARLSITLSLLFLAACDAGPPRGANTGSAADSVSAAEAERVATEVYLEAVSAADSIAHEEISESSRYGGTIVVAGRNDVLTLNPLVATDIESVQHQAHVLFTTLVRSGPDFEPLPYLAREWTIDPEGDRIGADIRQAVDAVERIAFP